MFTNIINIYHVGQQVSVDVDSWARFSGIESFANEFESCAMHANLMKAPTGEGICLSGRLPAYVPRWLLSCSSESNRK